MKEFVLHPQPVHCAVSSYRPHPSRPHRKADTLSAHRRICNRLRAGRETPSRDRRVARPPQSTGYRRYPACQSLSSEMEDLKGGSAPTPVWLHKKERARTGPPTCLGLQFRFWPLEILRSMVCPHTQGTRRRSEEHTSEL